MSNRLKYCPNCLGNDITSKDQKLTRHMPGFGEYLPSLLYTVYKGFIGDYYFFGEPIDRCPTCNEPLITMNLTTYEWGVFHNISLEQNFIFAMDKLKQDNIIEFNLKMSQFSQTSRDIELSKIEARKKTQQEKQANIPKCPTCGSTNIKKISGTKRWFSTGILGIGSSDVGKSMQCNSCGYKW